MIDNTLPMPDSHLTRELRAIEAAQTRQVKYDLQARTATDTRRREVAEANYWRAADDEREARAVLSRRRRELGYPDDDDDGCGDAHWRSR